MIFLHGFWMAVDYRWWWLYSFNWLSMPFSDALSGLQFKYTCSVYQSNQYGFTLVIGLPRQCSTNIWNLLKRALTRSKGRVTTLVLFLNRFQRFGATVQAVLMAVQSQSSSTQCLALHISLQWRHNGRDGVSNHQPHDCLLNRFIRS